MQPTKEEMLSKIYEAVSDKELRFGCIMDKVRRFRFLGKDYNEDGWTGRYRGMDDGENVFTTTITGSKVIGNPVMIGDVLKWIEENYRMNYNLGVLFSKE